MSSARDRKPARKLLDGDASGLAIRSLTTEDWPLVERLFAVLALAGADPVGWCCFGPRNTFARLETVRALKRRWTPIYIRR